MLSGAGLSAMVLVFLGSPETAPVSGDAGGGAGPAPAATVVQPTAPVLDDGPVGAGVGLELWASTPQVLEVRPVRGLSLRGRHTLGDSPFFLGAALAWGRSSGTSPTVRLRDDYFEARLGAGAEYTLGRGRLFAQAWGGGRLVYESQHRRQSRRLRAAGLPTIIDTSWYAGPAGGLELGVELTLYEGLGVLLAAGPMVTTRKQASTDEVAVNGGYSLGLGVAYAF